MKTNLKSAKLHLEGKHNTIDHGMDAYNEAGQRIGYFSGIQSPFGIEVRLEPQKRFVDIEPQNVYVDIK